MRKILYGGAVTGLEEEQAIIKSIRKSRKTKNWQQAEEGKLFEEELAKYVGVRHAILTSSGSCAGLLALSALELPKGSEVIISAVTFPTIFNIIVQCGLIPVVVDAELGTYGFDVKKVEQAITKKTSAIIAIHPLGNPVDMPKLMQVAKKYGIKVIGDNCDGLGTSIDGKMVDSFPDISITSLHAAHIVSMGVGGVVFTDDDKLAENVRMYRDWGRKANTNEPNDWPLLPKDYNPRFVYEKIGYNFQILELQAAMGRVQLKKIDKIKEARKKNFDYLYKHLSKHEDLIMPVTIPSASVCWFSFPISYWDRKSLVPYLEGNGIETRSMFSGNILNHPAYQSVEAKDLTSHSTEFILGSSFWISCHPRLTKADLKYIVNVFDTYFNEN